MSKVGRGYAPAVFEFYLIKDEAEDGIIDSVPDLDDQQHHSYLGQGNALHGKIGGNECGSNVVINVLTNEVGPVTQTLLGCGHVFRMFAGHGKPSFLLTVFSVSE